MTTSYSLFILLAWVSHFLDARAGTVSRLPTPRHQELAAALDAYALPKRPTEAARAGLGRLALRGDADLETLFRTVLGYLRAAESRPSRPRVHRILSLPVASERPAKPRDPRRTERVRRLGNDLMYRLRDDSAAFALITYRFTQFDLWSDASAWALSMRLGTKSVVLLQDSLAAALPRLTPAVADDLLGLIASKSVDRRLRLWLAFRADRLTGAALDEALDLLRSEYERTISGGVDFDVEWAAWENRQFAEVVESLRARLEDGDVTVTAAVAEARRRNPSRIYGAFGRGDFAWLHLETWPGPAERLRLRPTGAPHLRVVDPDCEGGLL